MTFGSPDKKDRLYGPTWTLNLIIQGPFGGRHIAAAQCPSTCEIAP